MLNPNKILLSLLTGFCLVSTTACTRHEQSEKLVLDIRRVIKKTPEEVVSVLGKPDTTYFENMMGRQIYCQRYLVNNVEIQYWGDKSTDIVVYGPHGLPFNQNALKAFNISHKMHPSQYEQGAYMRWYDVDEFKTIGLYNVEKDSTGQIKNFNIYFKVKS